MSIWLPKKGVAMSPAAAGWAARADVDLLSLMPAALATGNLRRPPPSALSSDPVRLTMSSPPARNASTTTNATSRFAMSPSPFTPLRRAARALVGNRIGHWTAQRRRPVPRLGEQGFDELVGVELDEVAGLLAQAHELDGDAELGLDGEGDAAL